MLPVFICEDNPVLLQQYRQIIENVILIEEYDMKLLAAVTSPDELLDAARSYHGQTPDAGFYLLDIDLQASIDGFELAKKIREFDSRGFIVFITTHSEMAMLTFKYKVEAMDFILKDESWNIVTRIHECLDQAVTRYLAPGMPTDTIAFKIGHQTIKLRANDILYIMASPVPHKILVVMENRTTELYGTLTKISHDLPAYFIRSHKGCLVNLNHVRSVDRETQSIYLTNGTTCLASTRGINLVSQALQGENRLQK